MYEPTWRTIPEKRIGYSAAKWAFVVTCCLTVGLVMYGIADAATDDNVRTDICEEAFTHEPGDREQPREASESPRRARTEKQPAAVSKETSRGSEEEEAVRDISEEPGSEEEKADSSEDSGETWIDAEPVFDIYDGEDEPEYYEPVDEQMDGGIEDDGEDVGVSGYYTADEFQFEGRVYDQGREYTWYSEQVLPGGGLDIPGRHVDEDGYIRDGDGNLCCASSGYSYGEKIEVPFGDGTAIVYDTTEDEADNLVDMYVSW